MSNIGALVERMVAAGMSVGDAGAIAAEIYAAGVASASIRSPGAERTRRYRERHKTSQSVTPSRDDNASQNVTERHKASQSDVSPKVPIERSLKKEGRQLKSAASRGTRLNPSWTPTEAGRLSARQEGFSDAEIDREILQFRDHWIAASGSKAVKLDWDAAWRTWYRRSADMKGKKPTPMAGAEPKAVDVESAVKLFAKTGIWSRWAGPEPSQLGCQAPPELFAKYGLLPDGRKIEAA
jgi:hypothetical protein